jgi:hypothetical protein
MRRVAGQVVKNSENWVLAVLGALGTVFFIQTFHYRFSAGLFPRIVNTVLAFLCFYRLYKNIKEASIGRTAGEEKTGPVGTGLRWYWSFVITVLYFGMICLIGFVWATGLFLLTFPIAAGYKRWMIVFIVAVATALLTEIIFSMFLQLSLPKGILFTLINR